MISKFKINSSRGYDMIFIISVRQTSEIHNKTDYKDRFEQCESERHGVIKIKLSHYNTFFKGTNIR